MGSYVALERAWALGYQTLSQISVASTEKWRKAVPKAWACWP